MIDDTNTPDDELVDDDGTSNAECYGWTSPSGKSGLYIFPQGVEVWASNNDIAVVHIDCSTGTVTAQHAIGQPFRDITKEPRTGTLTGITK